MAVFTFYGYGTGEDQINTANVISQFSQASAIHEPDELLIMDGPDALGTIVARNARNGAHAIIKWLKKQESDEHTINLTGYSRGAVTCIRIANILKRKQTILEGRQPRSEDDEKLLRQLNHIDLNLFLIDPVAGLTDKGHPINKIIPDNVSHCVSILQKDERRQDFKPQDLTRMHIADSRKTKVSMLPMYGAHSDITKIKGKRMDSGPAILWFALYHFLIRHGSKFNNNEVPQLITSQKETSTLKAIEHPRDLLNVFSAHHEQRDKYYQSGIANNKFFDGIPAPRTERTLNQHARYYVKNPEFFVNQLERELFKLAYPKVFNYLFEQNIKDPRFPNDSHCTKSQVKAELQQIKQNDPLLFRRLEHQGIKINGQQIILGSPQGYKTLESCRVTLQIIPDFVPETARTTVEEMSQLNVLENEVYRTTFQYERAKSELNFAGKREQSDTTRLIREEIEDIVNNSPLDANGNEDREGKCLQILDKLEQHYKWLTLSQSTSDLNGILEHILAVHGRHYTLRHNSELNQLLVKFVHASLSLVKFTVQFVGSLGYVGGSLFYGMGFFLESIGKRSNELIGQIGWNPLKTLGSIIATILEVIGFAVKNSFGLKPLTDLLVAGIRLMDGWILNTINSTTVERINPELLRPLLAESATEETTQVAPDSETGKTPLSIKEQLQDIKTSTQEAIEQLSDASTRSQTTTNG